MFRVRFLLSNAKSNAEAMGEIFSKRAQFGVNRFNSDRACSNGNDNLRNTEEDEAGPKFLSLESADGVEDPNTNDNNSYLRNRFNQNNNRASVTKGFDPTKIKVQVNAYIEDKETTIEEKSPVFVKYKTPSFKAEAAVMVPEMKTNEHWKVGWVQACHKMKFVNIYGKLGMTSWEFPELNRGLKMLSDSDGVHFPWYGNRHEVRSVFGPTNTQTFNIRMSDSFSPQITWVPPNGDKFEPGDCKLTEIHRDQSFHSWVVARNEITEQVVPLKTVIWRMQINIDIDPTKPLGQRGTSTGPSKQIQPEVLTHNEPIPPNALVRPHCNAAQMLLWRPDPSRNERLGVVIPPKWEGAPTLTQADVKNPVIEAWNMKHKHKE